MKAGLNKSSQAELEKSTSAKTNLSLTKILKPALLLLALAGAAWFAYQRWLKKTPPTVETQQPQYQDIVKNIELAGQIDAKKKARLRFMAGGKLTYLGAQEGDWVKQYQTLATIDQRELQKRLQQDLNNYMKERWDWEQQLDDIEHRWLDMEEQRQVDKNQWDLENQVLSVEIRDIAISNTVMTAPFAGVLVATPTNVSGMQLLSSDYFELVDPQSLIFRAEVDEEDVAKLQPGQNATLTLDAYDQRQIQTQVDYISYRSSQGSAGTVFLVEFPLSQAVVQQTKQSPATNVKSTNVKNANAKNAHSASPSPSATLNPSTIPSPSPSHLLTTYRLGMNGDVKVQLEQRAHVLTIPFIATRQRDGQTYVDVKQGEEIISKEIETGLETEDLIEVKSGLTAQDQVVIPQNE